MWLMGSARLTSTCEFCSQIFMFSFCNLFLKWSCCSVFWMNVGFILNRRFSASWSLLLVFNSKLETNCEGIKYVTTSSDLARAGTAAGARSRTLPLFELRQVSPPSCRSIAELSSCCSIASSRGLSRRNLAEGQWTTAIQGTLRGNLNGKVFSNNFTSGSRRWLHDG